MPRVFVVRPPAHLRYTLSPGLLIHGGATMHLKAMARSTSTNALPLKTLRDHATALEASILECLAKPAKKSVHKLRTSTRRIEAQLELLAMLPELPAHDRPKQKLLKLLKKLRQAAGQVRDLDVQRDLIADSTSKKRGPQAGDTIRKEARQLRQELKSQRNKQADDLVTLLQQEKADLPLAFKQFFDSLGDFDALRVSEPDLIAAVRTWYTQRAPSSPPALDDVEHLHDIRKEAKLARYLAETAPSSARKARRLAAEFEELQEAGGQWHDWLLLSEIARAELGDSAQLPRLFAARASKSLKQFERRIEKMSPQPTASPAKAA
jgi:CHAD domain-containing protein